jgi:hypothetical protein
MRCGTIMPLVRYKHYHPIERKNTMKNVSILLSACLFCSFGATAFGGGHHFGYPYATTKVVYPRIVQKSVVLPTSGCEPTVGVDVTRLAKVKVVQPRIVQKSVAMTCNGCSPAVDVDPTRLAKVKVVYPKIVQRQVVAPACYECEDVAAGIPRVAKVKVVYPKTVTRAVMVPVMP